jgi:diguanylate cyclase (GGDEF)-like protein/PAS domain S-box-containing protein
MDKNHDDPDHPPADIRALHRQIATLTLERDAARQDVSRLRAERDAWRLIAESTADWEFWRAPDGSFRYVSPACERITGYPPDAFQSDPGLLERIVHPDDQERLTHHLQATRHHQQPHDLEFRIIRRTGEECWIAHTCRPVYGRAGEWLGQRAGNHDITAHKQMQYDLALARATVESATEGVLVTTPDGRVLTFNQRFVALFHLPAGWEQIDDVPTRLRPVLDQVADPDSFLQRIAEIMRAPEQDSYDVIPLRDGRIMSRHSTPFRLNRQICGRLWSFHDITAYQQTVDTLRAREQFIQQVATTIPGIIYVYDVIIRHNIYNNGQITDILGYTVAEIQAMGDALIATLLHPDDQQRYQQHRTTQAQSQDDTLLTIEYRMRHRDGTWRWMVSRETIFARTPTGQVQQILGVAYDITERKQAEDALRAEHQRFAQGPVVTISWQERPGWPVTYVSPNIAQFGYTANALTSGRIAYLDLIHPDDRERVLAEIGEMRRTTVPPLTRQEYRLVCADGTVRHVADCSRLVSHDAGAIERIDGYLLDITARKQAEEALRAQTAQLQAIFENAAVGMSLVTPEGRYLHVNRRILDMFGYTFAELAQKKVWDLTYPDDREVAQAQAQAFQRGEIAGYRLEKRYVRKDGSIFWGELSISAVRDAQQTITHVVGIITDITARKQAEDALRMSEERYIRAVSAGQVGVWEWNLATNAMYLAPNLKAMLGYADHEIRNHLDEWGRLVHPDDRDMVLTATASYLRGDSAVYEVEHRMLHKDGSVRWMVARGSAFYDASGTPIRIAGTDTDITERKQLEIALYESRALLQAVLDNAPLVIVVKDRDGRYLLANRQAAANLHLSPNQLVSTSEDTWFPSVYVDAFLAGDRQVFATGKPITVEDVAVLPDTTAHTYLAVKFPLTNAQGEIAAVGVIAMDITERKQLERALHQRVQQLEALGETMHQITSELNLDTLLHAILQRAMDLVDGASGQVLRYDPDQHDLVVLACTNMEPALIGTRQPLTDHATGHVIRTRTPLIIPDYQTWAERLNQYAHLHARALLLLPLLAGAEIHGILIIGHSDPTRRFTTSDIEVLTLFAQQATIALHNAQLFAEVQYRAIIDPLTRLHNRRYLDETLPRELQRAARQVQSVGVMLLDIDHFKQINDTYGHDAGDSVLLAVGAFLKAHTRGDDIACRYGGEEFILVLPGAFLRDTQQRAEEVRRGVQSLIMAYGSQRLPPVTISLGVAGFPDHGTTAEALIRAADQALYQAKRSGRNCVVVVGGTGPSPPTDI